MCFYLEMAIQTFGTSSCPTTTSKMSISSTSKSHFDYLKWRFCFSTIFKNHMVLFFNSFLVFVVTTTNQDGQWFTKVVLQVRIL